METLIGRATLAVIEGDITQIAADAIGNAANSSLAGGGGVDGAIHMAGGPAILAELRARFPHGTPTGTAVLTTAGGLPARWVVHAVGPIWQNGRHGEEGLLAAAYRAALEAAAGAGARTLTLPAISAGVYGYPVPEAARVALASVARFLASDGRLERVTFVCYSPSVHTAFEAALADLARARQER